MSYGGDESADRADDKTAMTDQILSASKYFAMATISVIAVNWS